jgi:alpha-glucosidase
MGNTTEELCARWIQVGALYPFARNHNHEEAIDQEFDVLGPTLLQTAKVNLKMRYSILRYYYSLMIENVTKYVFLS